MKKTFVLDTNVLLHDPKAFFAFEDNEVVIPIYVIEEIDNFKKDLSELGRNARQIARNLDEMRLEGVLTTGAPTAAGGTVRVAITTRQLPPEYYTNSNADNQILATALQLHEHSEQDGLGDKDGQGAGFGPVIFVTKDVNLRLRAAALGITVEDYDIEQTDISELYSGIADITLSADDLFAFSQNNTLPLSDPYYFPGQFAVLRTHQHSPGEPGQSESLDDAEADPSRQAVGKIDLQNQCVVPLEHGHKGMWGIRPRNKEQSFAAELLLDDSIRLVTLVGKAGTGKTLLAIAAGLQKVTEENAYQKLLVARPIFPLGKDIGYLPGDLEEKMNPWMQPIFDNVEFLMGLWRQDRKGNRSYHELIDLGVLDIEPLTYIRGRSIPNQFMIVDEAQNLTPHEVKTIISRAGDNTKIVLTGDPYQIDNPYVDSSNNGLVHAVNRFRGERIAGHVTLSKGERSELATLATNLL